MMRKYIGIILLFSTFFFACKKNTSPPYHLADPAPAITKYATLDHTDSLLIGNWIIDSAWHYELYPMISFFKNTQYYSDPSNCHLQLSSNLVAVNYSYDENWKGAVNGLFCYSEPKNWKVTNRNILNISNEMGFTIKSVNSIKLVLYLVGGIPGGCDPGKAIMFYLHKQ